jgi:hypothetical protein
MYDDYNRDYYDLQIAEAVDKVEDIATSSSLSGSGTSVGQVAVWDGGAYVPADLSGDSTGVSLSFTGGQVKAALSQNLTAAGNPTFATIAVTDAGTTRTNLGLGTVATKNVAAAVANLSTTASAGYVQAELQATIDKLNALLGSLRTAGIIAT